MGWNLADFFSIAWLIIQCCGSWVALCCCHVDVDDDRENGFSLLYLLPYPANIDCARELDNVLMLQESTLEGGRLKARHPGLS
jgi:hypothetical protein